MRDHHLRQRRQRLGLSQPEFARRSGMRWSASVSAAELRPDTHPGCVDQMRRGLIKLELEGRVERRLQAVREREFAADRERIVFQRSLWAALPDHPAKRALQAAMLDRCIDLMDAGGGEETDAIAEFLPESEVTAMFDRWLDQNE